MKMMSELKKCDQNCGNIAHVYACDSCPDGWGGFYCVPCQEKLGFIILDKYPEGVFK